MKNYNYTSYDYSKIIKPKLELCYPNSNFYRGETIIENTELKNNTLYVTYYDGVDRIVVDFNINDLIGAKND